MLHSRSVNLVTRLWRLSGAFGILPLRWNSKTRKFEHRSSKLRYAVCVTELVIYSLYELFLLFRWIQSVYFDPTATKAEKISLQYTTSASLLTLGINFGMILNYGDHGGWFNRFVSYFCTVGEEMPNTKDIPEPKKGLRAPLMAALTIMIINSIGQFRRPTARQLFSSMMPNPMALKKWQLLLFLGLQMYIWLYQWITMTGFFLAIILYLHGAYWNQQFFRIEISKSRQNSDTTSRSQRFMLRGGKEVTREQLASYVRKLDLVQLDFNATWQFTTLIVEVLLVICCVMSFTACIRVEGIRSLQLAVVFAISLLLIVAIWNKMADIFESSMIARDSWKVAFQDVWWRKFHRASKPNRVVIGSFFYADRFLVLTLIKTVIESTVNLLVSTR